MKELPEYWLLIAFLVVAIIALIISSFAVYYSLKNNQVKAEKWFNSRILAYLLLTAVIIAFIGWVSFGLKYGVWF